MTRARISAIRKFEEKHKKVQPVEANNYLTDLDGVTIWASTEDLSPGDDFI